MTDKAQPSPLGLSEIEGTGLNEWQQYVSSISRYRWIVLTITLVAMTVSTLYISRLPDIYTAVCSVLLEEIETKVLEDKELKVSKQRQSDDYYNTQLVFVKSSSVLLAVAEQLNLKEHYGVTDERKAAAVLKGKILASRREQTQLINIEVKNKDRIWAAKLANAVAQAYISETLRQRFFVSKQILQWLPEEIGTDTGADPLELFEKMDDPTFAESIPSVAGDNTILQLKSEKLKLESKFNQLLGRYTPEHPNVRTARNSLEHIDKRIKAQTAKVVARLKRNLAGEFNLANIKVFEKAVPPNNPSGPARIQFILIASAGGLMFAMVLAVILGTVMQRISSEEDLVHLMDVPYLGHVPLAEESDASLSELLEDHLLFDAMTMIHTAVIFAMPRGKNKVIMVTSCIAKEGKTTLSTLLAHTMARLETNQQKASAGTTNKILLVECDLRRPSLVKSLNLKDKKSKGMSEFLIGKAEFEEVVSTMPDHPNLHIITAGADSPNPSALFSSNAFDDFLEMVKKKYARVIIDVPPYLSIPEAAIISKKVDGTVFVIGAGMLQPKLLLKAAQKSHLIQSTVFGYVLNKLNISHKSYYHGYYKHDEKRSKDQNKRKNAK